MSETVETTPAPLISAQEAKQRVADGAVLLDTRSPGGREKTGAIVGAVIVDRDDLDAEFDFDSPSRHQEVVAIDTPIVVVCGSVDGSGPVAEALRAKGFVDVVHVDGGASAWHEQQVAHRRGDRPDHGAARRPRERSTAAAPSPKW